MNSIKSFSLIAAALLLASCQDLMFDIDSAGGSVSGFTINATYGTPASKAAFEADGLTLCWTPGDVLYLVDPENVNPTVTLTTDITEAAGTAKFHTDELLATGKYLVLFGQEGLDVDKDITICKDLPDLDGQIRLYGEVEVTMGDTQADVVLHHLFAMLSFQMLNVPDGYSSIRLGMAVSAYGIQTLGKGKIGFDGLTADGYSGDFQAFLGYVDGFGADDRGRTLITPVDLSTNQVIFYVTFHDGSTRRVYTFFKSGIDIQAGKSYAITLDFDKATDVTIFEKQDGASVINDADDFLAAALLASGNSFVINKDIDFSGKAFLPIKAGSVRGNGHTLSNIQCGLMECDYVGVLSEGGMHDLNVVDSYFSGRNHVGAISGYGYCSGCTCTNITIIGNTYVGGLVGRGTNTIDSSSLHGISTVNGQELVGGIVGHTMYPVENCVARGEVIYVSCDVHGHYAGGIAANAEDGVAECGFEGMVCGGYYVGGVAGKGSCTKCYCAGDIEGAYYVGGISGCSGCADCFFIGQLQCFASSGAGISGSNVKTAVTNCYSCGDISTGIGICAKNEDEYKETNLTSAEYLYDDDPMPEYCNCGTAGNTFLDGIDVINGNDAYLPICWPDNDAECPLLAWQYEGFGGEIPIPSFTSVTW